jgi:hypothetical protein
LICATVAAGLVCLPGCSLFGPKTQTVKVTATDSLAQLYVDGRPVGTGAATLELDRTKSHAVTAKSYGRAGAVAINKKISATGVLDIVGGCLFLVPFIGAAGPGFWDLDPTDVTVQVQ